ncbi:MAG: YncE family protein [Thaumarchaeota archaeon]|nr:YncE family protein [Nitrososphaerota archaeon]
MKNLINTGIFEENPEEHTSLGNATQIFQPVQTISLPSVQGRIDHMDIDLRGERLFVAEIENNSVGIIDLKTDNVVYTITGLYEPQGVLFIPESNEIIVSNGGDGTVKFFDAASFSPIKTISLSSDADNMRYDSTQKLVYVGYGNGGLAIIDPITNKLVGNIVLDGHPESFQISDELSRIFVNVPADDSIVVVDLQKRTIVNKWQNNDINGNYPMALDEDLHRLFVGYRNPPQLSVIGTDSGKTVATVNIPQDPDDIFYDESTRQIYVSGGDGFDYVVSDNGGGNYNAMAKIPTGQGARTSLLVPQTERLYVAVPNYSIPQAQILVYDVSKIR